MQVLFGDECVDEVALQELWEQHPSGLQGKHKQAKCAKKKIMVFWFIVFERERGVEVSGAGRDQEVAGAS